MQVRVLAFAAVALSLSLWAPFAAAQEEDFSRSLVLVFADYPSPQREAIRRQAWTESKFEPCVVSKTHDEGLFQLHGERRADLHRYANLPAGICVPILTQVRFMRREWEGMAIAHLAFMRAPNERMAYRILRGVYGRGLSLVTAMRRREGM